MTTSITQIPEINNTLDQLWSAPFIMIAICAAGVATTLRYTLYNTWPWLEDKKLYKFLMPWANIVLGISFACAAKGSSDVFDTTWGYVVVIGVVAGIMSNFIWSTVKTALKAKLNIGSEDKKKKIKKTEKIDTRPDTRDTNDSNDASDDTNGTTKD